MSNRKFSPQEWNERHLKRVESFARRIDLIYHGAIIEASQIAVTTVADPEKPFAFEDYPQTAERIENLFRRMALEMLLTIETGQEEAWAFSADKNDALTETVWASAVQVQETSSATPPPAYKARNQDALESFKARKIEGLNLSDRVWKYTGQFRKELELGIDLGLGEGKSATQMSRDIRGYLNEPEQLFRRVRNKRGNLVASKAAKAYHPGQGIYRSSYKNAMRLTRTEINAAYREADHVRFQQLDFVVGFEVRRSNNPGDCDTCAKLKGRYPKTFKFNGWHPQCRCHVVSILATPAEFRELNRMILNGKDTDDFRSVNEVNDVPDNFKEWVSDNSDRIKRAKAKPQFLTDNYPDGDPNKKPTYSVTPPIQRAPEGIDLSKLIKGQTPTNAEMKAVIMEYARQYPDSFSAGLESVSILKSQSYLMQHSRLYSPTKKEWTSQSSISISTHSFSISGQAFNPAEELRGAFAAMKANTPLSFNQEYAVESLWHEILHGKTKRAPVILNRFQTQDMETVNQFIARHTYPDFLKAFNTNALHQQSILDNGYGYKSWVANFRARLQKAGISEQKAVDDFMPVLMSDYVAIGKKLATYFK